MRIHTIVIIRGEGKDESEMCFAQCLMLPEASENC